MDTLSDTLQQVFNNIYFQQFATVLGVISGLIAIIQIFKTKNHLLLNDNNNPSISYESRGLCADCESIISNKSQYCIKCGSTDPFNIDRLKWRVNFYLDDIYEMAKYFPSYIENVSEFLIIATFVILFIFSINLISLTFDYEIIKIIIDVLSTIIALLAFVYFLIRSHVLIPFSLNKKSIKSFRLSHIDNRLLYIINSVQGLSLNQLRERIYEFKGISNTTDILTKKYSLMLTIVELITGSMILPLLYHPYNVSIQIIDSNQIDAEDVMYALGLSLLIYFQIKLFFKLAWVHHIYSDRITGSIVNYHLDKYIKTIDEKILDRKNEP